MHQKFSAPLDGMYGSKAVNKTLLGVSSKIGEAKGKKELEFFNATGFDCDPELGGPLNQFVDRRLNTAQCHIKYTLDGVGPFDKRLSKFLVPIKTRGVEKF